MWHASVDKVNSVREIILLFKEKLKIEKRAEINLNLFIDDRWNSSTN